MKEIVDLENNIIYLINNIQIVFSEDMVSTIAYLIKKENLNNFTHFFKNYCLEKNFNIAPFDISVINMACNYYNNQGDFEDYLQYFCAKKENCCAVYTTNKKFPNLKIPIKNIVRLIFSNKITIIKLNGFKDE